MRAFQRLLGRLAEKVPAASPLGQRIAYERAARTEPREEKVKAYVALANRFPYPIGAYWDDSLFTAANLEVDFPSGSFLPAEAVEAAPGSAPAKGSEAAPIAAPAKGADAPKR